MKKRINALSIGIVKHHVSCGCCHVSYNCCHVSLEGRTVGATEKGKKTLTLGAGQFECWNESESEFVEKKRLWQDNSFGEFELFLEIPV